MKTKPITKEELDRYLSVTDLSQDGSKHAIRKVYDKIVAAIEETSPRSKILVRRSSPITTIEDNYDNLLIPKNNIGRSSTYTHYVDDRHLLRTQTSAGIPPVLRELSVRDDWDDITVLVPGLVYRRDVADKKHVGQIQSLDVWRVVKTSSRSPVTQDTLTDVVKHIADAAAPGWSLRIESSPHPYTIGGREVNATHADGRDIEILECGLIGNDVLELAGLDPQVYSGWALGMGLDRLVMTLKDIPDIRYLRSNNSRIAAQMSDLEPYREVSMHPSITRDISYCVPSDYVEEDVSQAIMTALGDDLKILEEVEIMSRSGYKDLNKRARTNLGISNGMDNLLVRVTLRSLDGSISRSRAAEVYDKIYPLINHGDLGYN